LLLIYYQQVFDLLAFVLSITFFFKGDHHLITVKYVSARSYPWLHKFVGLMMIRVISQIVLLKPFWHFIFKHFYQK
jgi:hypothetical protein